MSSREDLGLGGLPQCVEAEKELVSIFLLDQTALRHKNVASMAQGDFYNTLCAAAVLEMRRMDCEGKEITSLLLRQRLPPGPDWSAFFEEIADLAIHSDAAKVQSLCDLICGKARLRELIYAMERASRESRNGAIADVHGFLAEFKERVTSILEHSSPGGLIPWPELTKSEIEPSSNLTALLDMPIDYLLEPLLPRGAVVLIQGSPKGGKSTFSLYMALCVALGKWAAGTMICPGSANVMLIEFEDSPLLVAHNISKYLPGLGLEKRSFPENLFFCYYPELWFPERRYVEAVCAEIKAKHIDLLVVDTLSYVHRVEDENSSAQIKPVMATLREIAKTTGVTVLTIHHAAKGDGRKVADRGRGSSS